jgi:tetratricopeptide (TPR) repeat protein
MVSKSLRAAAAALLIGSATVAVAAVSLTVSAEAAARASVAKPLQEAIRAAGNGNFSAARAAVAQAEGAGSLTPGDHEAIDKVKSYIDAKSGSVSGRGGLITDYNAGRYGAVIAAGRKGGLDGQSQVLVAQSYYLTHDYSGCTDYIRRTFGNGASDQVLAIQQSCAYQSGDKESQRTALELLVQHTNKPEYWSQLLQASEGTKGLTDHETLDIYRLKLMTGSLKTADDYMLLAQLALQMGFGAESQGVIKKGMDAKLLQGGRVDRLMGMATGQANANNAGAAKAQAGNGEAIVKYGEDLSSQQGRGPDAVKAIQAGIAKGVTDKANAQTRLGQAFLAAGQKDQAIRAFAAASAAGDPKAKVIAHLWEIYARTH